MDTYRPRGLSGVYAQIERDRFTKKIMGYTLKICIACRSNPYSVPFNSKDDLLAVGKEFLRAYKRHPMNSAAPPPYVDVGNEGNAKGVNP